MLLLHVGAEVAVVCGRVLAKVAGQSDVQVNIQMRLQLVIRLKVLATHRTVEPGVRVVQSQVMLHVTGTHGLLTELARLLLLVRVRVDDVLLQVETLLSADVTRLGEFLLVVAYRVRFEEGHPGKRPSAKIADKVLDLRVNDPVLLIVPLVLEQFAADLAAAGRLLRRQMVLQAVVVQADLRVAPFAAVRALVDVLVQVVLHVLPCHGAVELAVTAVDEGALLVHDSDVIAKLLVRVPVRLLADVTEEQLSPAHLIVDCFLLLLTECRRWLSINNWRTISFSRPGFGGVGLSLGRL